MLQRGRKFVKCEGDMNHNAKIPNIIVKHPYLTPNQNTGNFSILFLTFFWWYPAHARIGPHQNCSCRVKLLLDLFKIIAHIFFQGFSHSIVLVERK